MGGVRDNHTDNLKKKGPNPKPQTQKCERELKFLFRECRRIVTQP